MLCPYALGCPTYNQKIKPRTCGSLARGDLIQQHHAPCNEANKSMLCDTMHRNAQKPTPPYANSQNIVRHCANIYRSSMSLSSTISSACFAVSSCISTYVDQDNSKKAKMMSKPPTIAAAVMGL